MTLRAEDGVLRHRLELKDRSGGWELRIADVFLIAEYTTNEGPYGDDYFLVFWVKENGSVLKAECSFYVEGRDEALAELRRVLGAKLELGLASSTDWNSRVIWPETLCGRPYFEVTHVPPAGLLQTVASRVVGEALEYKVTGEVLEYLKGAGVVGRH